MRTTSPLLAKLIEWQGKRSNAAFCRDELKWPRTSWVRIKAGEREMQLDFIAHVLSLRSDFQDEALDEIKRRGSCAA